MESVYLQTQSINEGDTNRLVESDNGGTIEHNSPDAEFHFRTPNNFTTAAKKVRRRSSLFMVVAKNDNKSSVKRVDETSENSEDSEKPEDKSSSDSTSFLYGRSLRRSTIALRQPLPRKSKRRTKFEFYFSPAPQHVRPILSAAQLAARRLSVKAAKHLRTRRVRINMEPVVIDITPRSDKIPGVIKMPDSPPLSNESIGIICDTLSPPVSCSADNNQLAKGDGSNRNDKATQNAATAVMVDDVSAQRTSVLTERIVQQQQRKKIRRNSNYKISSFAMRLRNHRLSVLPPPAFPQKEIFHSYPGVTINSQESNERDENSSQDSQLPESSEDSKTENPLFGSNAEIGDKLVREKERSNKIFNDVTTRLRSERYERQIMKKRISDEMKLQSLPIVSTKDKVTVWMVVDNVCDSAQKCSLTNVANTNSNYWNAYESAIVEGNNDSMIHRIQKLESFIQLTAQNTKDEEAGFAHQSEIVTEKSESSTRKRRQSFLIANERINCHHNSKSKSASVHPTVTKNTSVVHKSASALAASDKVQMAPIFQKDFKPVERVKKKREPKATKSQIVALKESEKTQSMNQKSIKKLKKGRRADRVMCCITLDDGDDSSADKPQTSDVHQEATVCIVPTSRKSSSRGKTQIDGLDCAPFSLIGHVGVDLTAQQSNVAQSVRQFGIRSQSNSHPYVNLQSFDWPFASVSRKWTECAQSVNNHSADPQTLTLTREERDSEGALADHIGPIDVGSAKTAGASLHAQEEHFLRRIKPLLEDLRHEQWCEVLRPHSTNEFIGNEAAVGMVRSWIAKWKKHLENSMGKPTPPAHKAKKARRRKSFSSDCGESDEDYSDDDGEIAENVLILSGPCGCGKTALVYAIAEEMQMGVVELACNERRNASIMRSKICGATQNYQIANSALMRSFNTNSRSIQLSLILVDDADVTFADEENFWSTLTNICIEAKAPVILTCSDGELVERELSTTAYVINMDRPTAYQISEYLHAILMAFGIDGVSHKFLRHLTRYLKCDLRACINHLQLYSNSQQLLDSIPEGKKQKRGAHEDYLSWTRYLSSLYCRMPRRLAYSAHYRTHYSNATDAVNDEEWCESSNLLAEEYRSIVEREDTPIHKSISITRDSLFRSEYCSTSDIACDYVPSLVLIDKAWRNENSTSRRRLHYFDSLKCNVGGKELTAAIGSYAFPTQ